MADPNGKIALAPSAASHMAPSFTTVDTQILKGGASKKNRGKPKSAGAPRKVQGGGGCGCAGDKQSGGSLASDAVVGLVTERGWVAMNANATNKFFPFQSGGARQGFFKHVFGLLDHPMHKGGGPLSDLIASNLGGPAKRIFSNAIKKAKIEQGGGGGGSDAILTGVESLGHLFNPNIKTAVTGVHSKAMNGGYGSPMDIANSILDFLTLSGANKLGHIANDTSLFKNGKTPLSYATEIMLAFPSAKAKNILALLAQQHGGGAIDLASKLDSVNLDKLAALVGRGGSKGSGAAMLNEFNKMVKNNSIGNNGAMLGPKKKVS
jgi:hypothetical protein